MDNSIIHHASPYSCEKNLGVAYNEECENTSKTWVCFRDGDACFLDNEWGHRLEQVIKDNPGGDIFGCTTNRLRYTYQLFENRISNETNIMEHKRISDLLWRNCGTTCLDIDKPLAGVLLLFRRKVWEQIKFKDGIIGIDFAFCQEAMDAGYKIKLMAGIYIFHFYRMDKEIHNINHLL